MPAKSFCCKATQGSTVCMVSSFPETSLLMAHTRCFTYPSIFVFVARQILMFIITLPSRKEWKRLSIHRETTKKSSRTLFFFVGLAKRLVGKLYDVRTYMHTS